MMRHSKKDTAKSARHFLYQSKPLLGMKDHGKTANWISYDVNIEKITICLERFVYQIPYPYLTQQFAKIAQNSATVCDIPFSVCLKQYTPPQHDLFKPHIFKAHAELSSATASDAKYQHFINIWRTLYQQEAERKPTYFFRNLYGYQWGDLADMVEWFGLIEQHTLPNITQAIPVYASTTGNVLSVFICCIEQNFVLDFSMPQDKLPHMLEIANNMCALVQSWRVL